MSNNFEEKEKELKINIQSYNQVQKTILSFIGINNNDWLIFMAIQPA